MPWTANDSTIDSTIDSNIKTTPPNAPGVNTAATVRGALKLIWRAMRDQVAIAVAACDATTASLVERSLNYSATVYIRADTGDDARTGATNATTGTTGAIRTLDRAIALHSGKTQHLTIVLESGTLNLTADTYQLYCSELNFRIISGATLSFRKRTLLKDTANVTVGEGTSRFLIFANVANFHVSGTLSTEAHTGSTGTGDQFFYRQAQGAISICSSPLVITGDQFQTINISQQGTITLGTNTTLATYGTHGTNGYGSSLARYRRIYLSGTYTAAAGTAESVMMGNRFFPRSYHPTTNTDGNVSDGEFVISPTNNNLYWKRGGTIYKATAGAY
jgi:hypothetical protein